VDGRCCEITAERCDKLLPIHKCRVFSSNEMLTPRYALRQMIQRKCGHTVLDSTYTSHIDQHPSSATHARWSRRRYVSLEVGTVGRRAGVYVFGSLKVSYYQLGLSIINPNKNLNFYCSQKYTQPTGSITHRSWGSALSDNIHRQLTAKGVLYGNHAIQWNSTC